MARRTTKTEAAHEQLAVIYARYSSHNQKEESIEQQVDECMAFAKQNGYKVIDIYADKAISGRTDRRPNFQKMMKDAESRRFSVVIAYKTNRISRNMQSALTTHSKLERYGIDIVYAKEEFGNTASGRFAMRTMMNVNQFYSENLAEDVKRGMIDNAENCKVNGPLPYGYVKGPDGRYAIEEKEAAVVRDIFDRVIDGHSYASIAAELNARGIKTKRGGKWNKGSFHVMLRNDVYIGVYRHSGVVVEDGVPPIITKEVFYAVQDILDNKAARGHSPDSDYLLSGKLFCGHCDSIMVGVSGTSRLGKKHHYYVCNNRRLNRGCEKEYVQRAKIEEEVVRLTLDVIMQDDILDWIADNAIAIIREAEKDADLPGKQAELKELRKVAGNIMSAIEQGIITPTTKNRLLEVESEIERLEKSIARTKEAFKPFNKNEFIFYFKQCCEGDMDDQEFRRDLINTFVRSVYLWDDKIQIDYYFDGNHIVRKSPFISDKSPSVRTNSLMGHQKETASTKSRLFLFGIQPI